MNALNEVCDDFCLDSQFCLCVKNVLQVYMITRGSAVTAIWLKLTVATCLTALPRKPCILGHSCFSYLPLCNEYFSSGHVTYSTPDGERGTLQSGHAVICARMISAMTSSQILGAVFIFIPRWTSEGFINLFYWKTFGLFLFIQEKTMPECLLYLMKYYLKQDSI